MGIKIETTEDTTINDKDWVSVKKMGWNYEVCYCQHRNYKMPIERVNATHYRNKSTGEIKEYKKINNRSDSKAQLSQTFKRLRDYINTNVVDVHKCKWVTLTYEEKMYDTKQLYLDFNKFIKKLRYKYGKMEYIQACEPNSDGSWHSHCIFIFPNKAPYIPNKELSSMWGHGNTKTKRLEAIDNIGAYFTAYLGDMELEEVKESLIKYNNKSIKEVKEIDGKRLEIPKYYVKGARLHFYPPKFNVYRISRGIKKPIKEYMSYDEAKEKIGKDEKPIYTKAIKLTDIDKQYENKIVYHFFNKRRNNLTYFTQLYDFELEKNKD